MTLPSSRTTLAIDTAGTLTGLMLENQNRRAFRIFPAQKTTECFLPMLNDIATEIACDINDLSTIIWNAGPGSFTGLRLASAIIQGLTFERSINVLALDTFAALIQTQYPSDWIPLPRPSSILCAHDARADEVYWCRYRWRESQYVAEGEIQVSAPETVVQNVQDEKASMGAGSGFSAYPTLMSALMPNALVISDTSSLMPQVLANMINMSSDPSTATIVQGEQGIASPHYPHYVRHRVAKTLIEQHAWQERFLSSKL